MTRYERGGRVEEQSYTEMKEIKEDFVIVVARRRGSYLR